MWELDYKESWAPKNWCFWTVVLEKTLKVPWRSNQSILKEINPGYSLEAEAEAPILWSPDVKNWLTGKDPDAGKDWGQEEKRTTEDEMAGWHHQLNAHEFEQAPWVGDGQGGLASMELQRVGRTLLSNWANWHQRTDLPNRKSIRQQRS